MNTEVGNRLIEFLNFDVWGYLCEKYHISPKRKFDVFFYSLIVIAFLLDFYVIQGNFAFFSYTLIFGISVMLNDKNFYKIREVRGWEFFLGVFIIITSFTVVTPIKWCFFPETRIFGVFNGGVFIIGYFISFYGVRRYKTVFPFLIFYGALVILNGTWGFVVNDFAEKYIAPISSHLTYSFINFLGYPASISGTTITIISQNEVPISATIAGACSGIEGMILSIVMLFGLLMGSKIGYSWRLVIILVGTISMFFVNILRLSLTFIVAYYWGHKGLTLAHEWLGNIMFLMFILSFWFVINKIYDLKGGKNDKIIHKL